MAEHLVSTEWLEDHLADPSLVILEVSSKPIDVADYGAGHVPGSQFVYWKDLLWHDTDRQFPSPQDMAARLGERGVGEGTVVALVGNPFQFAAYAYWVMTMTGQESRCRLVDGGRDTWLLERRPIATAVPDVVGRVLPTGQADATSRIGRDDVLAGLSSPNRTLIDLRSPEEYRGERVSPPWMEFDHGAERRGHIPGARHLFFEDLLAGDGTLLPSNMLAQRFGRLEIDGADEIVTYCRRSHRASLGWFVLTRLLDRPDVRVYDGSWTEWGSIVGVPIAR